MGRKGAPALQREAKRLARIGPRLLLGICGDANHSFGYHLPANELPGSDYSRQGSYNNPTKDSSACSAIDIGMNWPASRKWLKWLIKQVRTGKIPGVTEVIGSLNKDGSNVRYWSKTDTPKWQAKGVAYTGSGHDHWSHVSIGRRWPDSDHKILAGWSRSGYQGDDMQLSDKIKLPKWLMKRYPDNNPAATVKTLLSSTYSHARVTKDTLYEVRDAQGARLTALETKLDALDTYLRGKL